MFQLEVMHGGAWHPLDTPQEISDALRAYDGTDSGEKKFSIWLEVAEVPDLNTWMKKNAYRHAMVWASWYPDIKPCPYDLEIAEARQLYYDTVRGGTGSWDLLSTRIKDIWIDRIKQGHHKKDEQPRLTAWLQERAALNH